MITTNSRSRAKKTLILSALAVMFVGIPVLAAVLVQNFVQGSVTVEDAPIVKEAGADDAATSFLTVTTTGSTVSNEDSADSIGADTNLTQEKIDFTCFKGDRTYYTDALRLRNTTSSAWNVNLTVEPDLAGNAATSGGDFGDNADIWMFVNNASAPVANIAAPNPAAIPAAWNSNYIQLESNGTALSVLDATTGSFSIPAGEQRQIGLVVDCGANVTTSKTGTFRLTVAATP